MEPELIERKGAQNRLYLTSSLKASSFIEEIDLKYLQLSDEEKEAVFSIPIDEYDAIERVSRLTGEEEAVRQGYMNQLKLHYGYPSRKCTAIYCSY